MDLDGVRKEKQVVFAKIKQLDEEKLDLEKDINALEEELSAVTEKRDKIFQSITEMRKRRDEGVCFSMHYFDNPHNFGSIYLFYVTIYLVLLIIACLWIFQLSSWFEYLDYISWSDQCGIK